MKNLLERTGFCVGVLAVLYLIWLLAALVVSQHR